MAGNERGPQHEESDVDVWAVGRFVVAMVAVLAIALGLLFGLFRYFEAATGGVKPAAWERVNPGKLPPEPRLEETPVEDLRKFREAEERQLNGYGWIDRENGVVRIPIARAMDLLAQRGLPARPQAGPQSAATDVSVPTESGLGAKMQPAGGPLAGELK
jgi:hypothetical protein